MKYLLMIYDDEKARHGAPRPEIEALHAEYAALVKDLVDQKVYLGGAPLQPTATATSVRLRGGKPQITDGPFAETREQLGGYFLVEAGDLDEALKIAARIPGARAGTIEVRPLAALPHE